MRRQHGRTARERHHDELEHAVQVNGLQSVNAIAAGGSHPVAVKSDGTVERWGDNSDGQLGDGTTTDSSSPVQVTGLSGIIAVAAGADDTIALKSDGTVWAWGDNSDGQLGDGTTTDSSSPVQVTGLSGVAAITGQGADHILALKSDGTVWAWGITATDSSVTEPPPTTVPSRSPGSPASPASQRGTTTPSRSSPTGPRGRGGDDGDGQLGNGSTTNATTPVAVNGAATTTSPPTAPNCAGKTVGGCYAAAKIAGFTNVHAIAVAAGYEVQTNGICLFRPYVRPRITSTTLGNVDGCNDGNVDQSPLPGQTGTTFSFSYADNSEARGQDGG